MANQKRLDSFTQAYFDAALWSSSDESDESGGEPLDKNYSISDFAPETRDKMIADCEDFQERFAEQLEAGDSDRAGHDFWLTRNRHGAGFWDGDWPEPQATELTNGAREYGEFDLYLGDPDEDGERMIYGPPEGAYGVREKSSDTWWSIWDDTRQSWLPDPLRGGFDNNPARYRTKAKAEQEAKRWRDLNPKDRFVVKRWESGGVAPRRATEARRSRYEDWKEEVIGHVKGKSRTQAEHAFDRREEEMRARFRNGDSVYDTAYAINSGLEESHAVRDYIAVDRNDRRVAGPFRSHGEAEQHVPPGGYVKFSSAQHRRAPPAPSSYPMFREARGGLKWRASGDGKAFTATGPSGAKYYIQKEGKKWVTIYDAPDGSPGGSFKWNSISDAKRTASSIERDVYSEK